MPRVLIDPPEGWKYGFPKEAPNTIAHLVSGVTLEEWFVANGYPQELIDKGMLKYCRYIFEEENNG